MTLRSVTSSNGQMNGKERRAVGGALKGSDEHQPPRTRAFHGLQHQSEEELGKGLDGGGEQEEGEQKEGRNQLEKDGKWTARQINIFFRHIVNFTR